MKFFGPDGREVPEAPTPPGIPADPVEGLMQANARRGSVPDEWTATPLWHGESLDYGLAIDMLRGDDPLGSANPPETTSSPKVS